MKEAPVRYTKKIELCCLCRSSGDRTNSCRVAKEGRCRKRCRKRQYVYFCTVKASKLRYTFRRCTSTEVQLLTRGLRLWGRGATGEILQIQSQKAVDFFLYGQHLLAINRRIVIASVVATPPSHACMIIPTRHNIRYLISHVTVMCSRKG